MKKRLSQLYGEVLVEVRKERDLTQMEVITDTRIDMSKNESGDRLIRLDNLHCLCWYYKIPISEFTERVDRKIKKENLYMSATG